MAPLTGFREPKTDEEKAARRKQDEEQAALPYTVKQNEIESISVEFSVPANLKARDLDIKFTRTTIKAGIKGQEPIIQVGQLSAVPLSHPPATASSFPRHVPRTCLTIFSHFRATSRIPSS